MKREKDPYGLSGGLLAFLIIVFGVTIIANVMNMVAPGEAQAGTDLERRQTVALEEIARTLKDGCKP